MKVDQDMSLQRIDFFDVWGDKTIYLAARSNMTYLVVAAQADIHITIVTSWSHCSCKIFGLFSSTAQHPVAGSLSVSLNHSHTSAEMEIITFLYDGAAAHIDGSVAIASGLDDVHGQVLERNVVLGTHISLKTLPKLAIASHNVTASHGASIDALDPQKLFYMMSRGLTKSQSQKLLVDGHIASVLSNFEEVDEKDILRIYTTLT